MLINRNASLNEQFAKEAYKRIIWKYSTMLLIDKKTQSLLSLYLIKKWPHSEAKVTLSRLSGNQTPNN